MFRPGQAGAGGTFASASDVLLTVTTPVTVLTYTPVATRNFLANVSFKSTLGTPTFKEPVFTPTNSLVRAGEFGNQFTPTVNGFVTALRWYKTSGSNPHIGNLWEMTTGKLLASALFTGETASGWQQVALATPVLLTAGTLYIVSFNVGQTDAWNYDGNDPASPFIYSPTAGYPFTFPVAAYAAATYAANQVPTAALRLRAGVDIVFSPCSALTLTLNWTDVNGAQSLVLLSNGVRPAGNYGISAVPINAVAGSPITLIGQATVASLMSITMVLS